MSHVVLFHSALGLRPAVRRFADALRSSGHHVTTPDLFEGAVFERLEDGVARRDSIGIPTLLQRATAAVEAIEGPEDNRVYAGFSMGAAPAQMLALTRPNARGVVLMHGSLPLQMLGMDRWPDRLPAQIHFAEDDPGMDLAVPQTLASASASSDVQLFRYAGRGHLFADEGSADYDAAHAELMLTRVLTFLRALGG
ncbi:Dienelactone hydrolase [Labilithrix luteola]|uniref:Dienelactone hydrolase n=1 Tax=Labilithrix luteola TaxID=1391654 RepID=A0A0K1PPX5_9BACT|nr:dienelactone hydrolase family protein [Labilithrix luteola]AKU95572.1 Dienelactone hydrolase [Labilithrix luteola]